MTVRSILHVLSTMVNPNPQNRIININFMGERIQSLFSVDSTVEPWLKTTLVQRPPCYKDHFQCSPFSLGRSLCPLTLNAQSGVHMRIALPLPGKINGTSSILMIETQSGYHFVHKSMAHQLINSIFAFLYIKQASRYTKTSMNDTNLILRVANLTC